MPKIFAYEVVYYGFGKDLEGTWFFPDLEAAEEFARDYNEDKEKRGLPSRVKIVREKKLGNERN